MRAKRCPSPKCKGRPLSEDRFVTGLFNPFCLDCAHSRLAASIESDRATLARYDSLRAARQLEGQQTLAVG